MPNAYEIGSIDLKEWWLVLSNGEWFCGKKHSQEPRKLVSLQKASLNMIVEEDGKGQSRPRMLFLTYPWLFDTLVIPEGGIWSALSEVNPESIPVQVLKNVVGSTEKLKLERRAQRSGLHLA